MAFYQCPKCKRIWQYPIEKCPECILALRRLKSEKIKVIGVTKVNIPTIFHPKVPYFVLVLEDDKGNRWVQKSSKEYKIGDEFMDSFSPNKKEAVAIWRIKYDILEAVEKVIELLGGWEVNENLKVFILPTLSKASHSYFRDNTSPEFLQAVLDFLFGKKVKPENIKIGAQSFDEVKIEVKAQKSGLLEVCQKNKVIPVDLATRNFLKKGDLEISEEVFNTDLILNLPILKMGKAQASENLFFLLKKENFLAQKYLSSEKEIFEKLKKELPECLTLAEANYVQDEKGFNFYLNLILASFSSQNLDRVFFEITKRGELPEILENVKIENLPIVGREIEEVIL